MSERRRRRRRRRRDKHTAVIHQSNVARRCLLRGC